MEFYYKKTGNKKLPVLINILKCFIKPGSALPGYPLLIKPLTGHQKRALDGHKKRNNDQDHTFALT